MFAYQYNTTVNTQTGAEERAIDATSHAAKLIQILTNAWRIAGSRKTKKVNRFSRVPDRNCKKRKKEKGRRRKANQSGERSLSSNFQSKRVGPYVISKKFLPVLFTVIHAINMKHYEAIRKFSRLLKHPNQ